MSVETLLEDRLVLLPEVEALTRMSGTTIWRMEKRGKFPRRTYTGGRCAWFQSQIFAYLKSLQTSVGVKAPPKRANEARRRAAHQRRAEREARAARRVKSQAHGNRMNVRAT
jgi:predicted DNA-binding transcriptional regulator AlpA